MADDVGTWNFNIYKGAEWRKVLTLTNDDLSPVDLSGYDAELKINGLSTVEGTIVDNTIEFLLTASETDLITFVSAKHVVNLVPADVDATRRILIGRAYLRS